MRKIILLLLVLSFYLSPVQAQTPANNAAAPLNLTQTNKQLDTITAKLNSGKEETADFVDQLTQIQSALVQARQNYAADLDAVQKKLNALGTPPEKPASEPAAIARQRKDFTTQADNNKAQIAQIDLQNAKIDEINGLILKIRNRQLLDNILVKQSSIFHPQEFWQSLSKFADFVFDLVQSPLNWYQNLSAERQETVKNNILTVIIVMFGALIAGYLLSRYIKRWFGYKADIERPDYSQKVRAGIYCPRRHSGGDYRRFPVLAQK